MDNRMLRFFVGEGRNTPISARGAPRAIYFNSFNLDWMDLVFNKKLYLCNTGLKTTEVL
jgi:hypothetical protein